VGYLSPRISQKKNHAPPDPPVIAHGPWSMEWNGADGKRRGACRCRSMHPRLVYKSDALQLQRLAIHVK
jgi:predicted secreted Zn-dependent protease